MPASRTSSRDQAPSRPIAISFRERPSVTSDTIHWAASRLAVVDLVSTAGVHGALQQRRTQCWPLRGLFWIRSRRSARVLLPNSASRRRAASCRRGHRKRQSGRRAGSGYDFGSLSRSRIMVLRTLFMMPSAMAFRESFPFSFSLRAIGRRNCARAIVVQDLQQLFLQSVHVSPPQAPSPCFTWPP